MTDTERTRLGHLLGPHGVQGGVKVYVLGDPAQFKALKRVYVEERGWLRVRRVETLAPGVALHLAGITTREGAEALRGLKVYADDAELPAPESGVYYYHELRGLLVAGADGHTRGEVVDVQDMGHQDVLVVRHEGGDALVPLQAPYVVVNLNAQGRPASLTLTADAPDDLLTPVDADGPT
ncbi:16S rRNA processing protein RimM [Deinococcus metalli]|uniref:Ribosome maturation factor RimM n=1 Tax=Deinococcus metalli TaxID=1141878 RepID=A0A7W8KHI6_9DEIO|nr:ribosome maturation factor RimM [Deinococcus metalli]MBB5378235.1 16S rRNA processing protein RimM [Deinococcus metalli]GHF57047.1 ribosome maturation factor RimM [Deinococcus metalli]